MTLALAEVEEWHASRASLLHRGRDTLVTQIRRFIEDWSGEYEFRVEREISQRVKSPARLHEKCLTLGLADLGLLLFEPYPVSDLVGARVIVRSLSDVEAFVQAFRDNGPMRVIALDDKNANPSPTGYRAVHIDSDVRELAKGMAATVPVEIQVKTLVQDAWGYFTHDEAYSRTGLNRDPRFSLVRSLQQVLADQLHIVDLMQRQLEQLSADAAFAIIQEPITAEVSLAGVLLVVKEGFDVVLRLDEAQRLLEEALAADIATIEGLRAALDPSSEEAEDVADEWRRRTGRPPRPFETAHALLARLRGGAS